MGGTAIWHFWWCLQVIIGIGSVNFGMEVQIIVADNSSIWCMPLHHMVITCRSNVLVDDISRRIMVVLWIVWDSIAVLFCTSCIFQCCGFSGLHLCSLACALLTVLLETLLWLALGLLDAGSRKWVVALAHVSGWRLLAILKDDVVTMVKQIDIRVGGFVIFLVEQVAPALLPF